MPRYTTGELAKLCGVTVRTVQYYDTRGVLVPAALSEGGRRLYSEDDLKRMKIICFLRELGLPLDAISQLLAEDDPGSVVALLLAQQEQTLRREIDERREKLDKLETLKKEVKNAQKLSVEDLGDIAYTMTNKDKLRKIHWTLGMTAIPTSLLEIASIALWIIRGDWRLFAVWLLLAIPYAVWVSWYYFGKVAYICPRCHTVFKPRFKEAFWARHTPKTRKLTCSACGRHGFCVEVAREEDAP